MYDFLLVVNSDHSSKLLTFWENNFFCILATDEQMVTTDALSRCRYRERGIITKRDIFELRQTDWEQIAICTYTVQLTVGL